MSKDIFSIIHLVRTVQEFTFSTIQTHYITSTLWHSDVFFSFVILSTSVTVVLDQRPYFEKYARTSVLPADFRTNTVQYGRVGRSASSCVVWSDPQPGVRLLYCVNVLSTGLLPSLSEAKKGIFFLFYQTEDKITLNQFCFWHA